MSGRHDLPERDVAKTGFTEILENLVEALPGAAGVALVDELGECVDYAGVLDPYEVRLASAHMQLELRKAHQELEDKIGAVRAMTVCAHKRTFIAQSLLEGYILILVFTGGAPLCISSRALAQAEYDIRLEGGWDPPPDIERWIQLLVDARPRPLATPSSLYRRRLARRRCDRSGGRVGGWRAGISGAHGQRGRNDLGARASRALVRGRSVLTRAEKGCGEAGPEG